MVVLIGLDAFPRILLVDSVLILHRVENGAIDRHRVHADLDALKVALTWYHFEPRVLSDLVDGVPLFGVRVEDAVKEVLGVFRDPLGRLKVSTEDLLVQVGRIRVLKRQISTDKCEEDDAAGPDVDVGAIILLSGNHFWSCVTGRTTCCL